jgi:hypothetical protein
MLTRRDQFHQQGYFIKVGECQRHCSPLQIYFLRACAQAVRRLYTTILYIGYEGLSREKLPFTKLGTVTPIKLWRSLKISLSASSPG